MSTFEEFESAPVGATATHPDGRRVIKTTGAICPWHTTNGTFLYDYEIVDYVLDPAPPSTAREALDLAWHLAYPVREGQVIPAGTMYLARYSDETISINTPAVDRKGPLNNPRCRTLDPIPDPTPDWLDAPAVIARIDNWHSCADPQVFARRDYHDAPSEWRCNGAESYPWQELRDVTPLYPKGQDA